MLPNAWYLPDTDWFAELSTAPRPDPEGQHVIGSVAELLHDKSWFGPAKVVAATHLILLSVEQLDDAITHVVTGHDLTELARLLCGLNLIQARLTHTTQLIAEHVDRRAFGLDAAPDTDVEALTDDLCRAGSNGELVAGHLQEAHLVVRTLTR